MPRMADWFSEVNRRIGVPESGMDGGGRFVDPTTPAAPTAPEVPTPAAPPEPTTPAAPAVTPTSGTPPLELFLRAYNSGLFEQGLTPEMYQYFHGDEIMKELQKYDPGAHWEDSLIGSGGEGGGAGVMGKRFVGSTPGQIITPASGSGIDLLNLRPSNWGTDGALRNPNAVYHDDLYGDVTHSGNIVNKAGILDKSLPYIAALISMGGPLAAGALAGAGIGAGAAGFTSGVTGGVAGLGAGQIPGAFGAGSFAGSTPWWAKPAVTKAPGLLNTASSYWNAPKAPVGRAPVSEVDLSAFGQTGASTRVPQSNDSSLVATAFADDPYGFSNRRG